MYLIPEVSVDESLILLVLCPSINYTCSSYKKTDARNCSKIKPDAENTWNIIHGYQSSGSNMKACKEVAVVYTKTNNRSPLITPSHNNAFSL